MKKHDVNTKVQGRFCRLEVNLVIYVIDKIASLISDLNVVKVLLQPIKVVKICYVNSEFNVLAIIAIIIRC